MRCRFYRHTHTHSHTHPHIPTHTYTHLHPPTPRSNLPKADFWWRVHRLFYSMPFPKKKAKKNKKSQHTSSCIWVLNWEKWPIAPNTADPLPTKPCCRYRHAWEWEEAERKMNRELVPASEASFWHIMYYPKSLLGDAYLQKMRVGQGPFIISWVWHRPLKRYTQRRGTKRTPLPTQGRHTPGTSLFAIDQWFKNELFLEKVECFLKYKFLGPSPGLIFRMGLGRFL